MRKIIQLSAVALPAVPDHHPEAFGVYVLADDGTAWHTWDSGQNWTQVRPLPQDATDDRPF